MAPYKLIKQTAENPTVTFWRHALFFKSYNLWNRISLKHVKQFRVNQLNNFSVWIYFAGIQYFVNKVIHLLIKIFKS